MPDATLVQLRIGCCKPSLRLQRTPKYLRFVIVGSDWKTLDALDQPEDEPREGEYVIAAVKVDEGSVHLDGVRNGRRFGEWHQTATYKPVENQPPQVVLRDRGQWREWAMAENAKEEAE